MLKCPLLSKSSLGFEIQMSQEFLVNVSNYAQMLCGVLALIAFVPQWKTILISKSSSNISLSSWCLWSFCTSITFFYSVVHYRVSGETFALMISTGFNVIFSVITLILIVYYRRAQSHGTSVAHPSLIKALEDQSVGLNNQALLPLRELADPNHLSRSNALPEAQIASSVEN